MTCAGAQRRAATNAGRLATRPRFHRDWARQILCVSALPRPRPNDEPDSALWFGVSRIGCAIGVFGTTTYRTGSPRPSVDWPAVRLPGALANGWGEASPRYGEMVRVTEDKAHFTGPLALRLPLACQFAVAPASTLATAAKLSPTPLPAESVNFTWIV
jgi:hypothetical protein